MLAVHQRGGVVRDRYSKGGLSATTHAAFSSAAATRCSCRTSASASSMVFKAFDRMSYALVMETTHEIRQGDPREKSLKIRRREVMRVTCIVAIVTLVIPQ